MIPTQVIQEHQKSWSRIEGKSKGIFIGGRGGEIWTSAKRETNVCRKKEDGALSIEKSSWGVWGETRESIQRKSAGKRKQFARIDTKRKLHLAFLGKKLNRAPRGGKREQVRRTQRRKTKSPLWEKPHGFGKLRKKK